MSQQSQRKLFAFWLPLAATWFMMSIEGPYVAAIIARLPDAKFNLAAYGVAFAIALILEAPIIMIMAATTALVKDSDSYKKLFKFTNILNLGITAGILLFLLPPVFNFVIKTLLNLPDNVAKLVFTSVLILTPWPAAIGYRRFFQGVLIVDGKTRKVALGTIARILSMSLTAILLKIFSNMSGAPIGAAALSTGVVFEAVAVYLMARKSALSVQSMKTNIKPLTYSSITKFYYPLALTSTIGLIVHPLIIFFVGSCLMPIDSLAVLPVVGSLVFIFRCVGLSTQEVILAKIGTNFEEYKQLRKFTLTLGTIANSVMILIAFTPLAYYYFIYATGLTPKLTEFALLPLCIMSIMPGLTFLITWQRAMCVNLKKTPKISLAALTEVVVIAVVMILGSTVIKTNGAVTATTAMVVGKIIACIYLSTHCTLPAKHIALTVKA